jgi:hypothetical protein
MPKISFCFSGWVNGANIKQATDQNGKSVDVSTMSPSELSQKLTDGELFISLGDHLYANEDAEIEMFDFNQS